MALRGQCPQCGVAFNVRESSVGTIKRCQNCGGKILLTRNSGVGCIGAIVRLVGLSFVAGIVVVAVSAMLSKSKQPAADEPALMTSPTPAAKVMSAPDSAIPASAGDDAPNLAAAPPPDSVSGIDAEIANAQRAYNDAKAAEKAAGGPFSDSPAAIAAQHATIDAQNALNKLLAAKKLQDAVNFAKQAKANDDVPAAPADGTFVQPANPTGKDEHVGGYTNKNGKWVNGYDRHSSH